MFDDDKDAIYSIQLEENQACIRRACWAKKGDVVNWLVSDAFGLHQARSVDAEEAIEAAEAWMRGERTHLPAKLASEAAIHEALLRALPGGDHFWPRWVVWCESQEERGIEK